MIYIILIIILLIIILYCNGVVQKSCYNTDIPIVIISWNNYYFVKNFINQLKKYKNRIIVLDNKSSYPPLLDYFKEIKNELTDRIDIRLLDKNYGHTVYLQLKDELPDVYILSDPDLQLNPKMPYNFDKILLKLSEQYESYKVGAALDLSDSDKFIPCPNYTFGKNIYDWESQFWTNKIDNNKYELYYADTDTTFCLVNNKYSGSHDNNIRIAGVFTAKHLPWYNNYIKNNIDEDEINFWKQNNKSSSILFSCLKL